MTIMSFKVYYYRNKYQYIIKENYLSARQELLFKKKKIWDKTVTTTVCLSIVYEEKL